MCRRRWMIGCCLEAFGVGALMGHWMFSGFWTGCISLGFCCVGFVLLRGR